jgi:hypothetical protein
MVPPKKTKGIKVRITKVEKGEPMPFVFERQLPCKCGHEVGRHLAFPPIWEAMDCSDCTCKYFEEMTNLEYMKHKGNHK